MKNNLKTASDIIIIGSALFSMFFGAGNMIFPPYLGLGSSSQWFGGFLGYFIADIILALVAIAAQIRTNGFEKLLDPLGKTIKIIMLFAIILCLGPVITIPRTAATTYELIPYSYKINKVIFYFIFFMIVILLCINESKVVDIVGKVLTPVLFLGLMLIIVMGVINPLGEIDKTPKISNAVQAGIEAGYQSMDVLAATIFGVLILNSATAKGHTSKKQCRNVTIGSSFVAGAGLFVIYLGLTYLGATVSQKYNMHISKSVLLTSIVRSLIKGDIGHIFFGVIASLACLSTAIALASSCAKFINKMSNGRLGYKTLIVSMCSISAFIASMGVENLIKFSTPILNIIYPPVLTVIILSFFHRHLGKYSYRLCTFGALIFSAVSVVFGFGSKFLKYFPLYKLGLGWILPALICLVIGILTDRAIARKDKNFN